MADESKNPYYQWDVLMGKPLSLEERVAVLEQQVSSLELNAMSGWDRALVVPQVREDSVLDWLFGR